MKKDACVWIVLSFESVPRILPDDKCEVRRHRRMSPVICQRPMATRPRVFHPGPRAYRCVRASYAPAYIHGMLVYIITISRSRTVTALLLWKSRLELLFFLFSHAAATGDMINDSFAYRPSQRKPRAAFEFGGNFCPPFSRNSFFHYTFLRYFQPF